MTFSIELPPLKLPNPSELKSELAKLAQEEMLATRNRIVDDTTTRHVDAEGRALRGYSATYLKMIQKREAIGYDGTVKSSTQTDLKITGLLMRSLQVKNTADGAECAFVGQHPLGQSKNHRQNADPKDRKTGSGKFGLGGRLAQRARKSPTSISNEQLAGYLYGLGYTGWLSFGKRDVERITRRVGDVLAKLFSR